MSFSIAIVSWIIRSCYLDVILLCVIEPVNHVIYFLIIPHSCLYQMLYVLKSSLLSNLVKNIIKVVISVVKDVPKQSIFRISTPLSFSYTCIFMSFWSICPLIVEMSICTFIIVHINNLISMYTCPVSLCHVFARCPSAPYISLILLSSCPVIPLSSRHVYPAAQLSGHPVANNWTV